jgi:hypothetical protein
MSFRYNRICGTTSDAVDIVRSAIPKCIKLFVGAVNLNYSENGPKFALEEIAKRRRTQDLPEPETSGEPFVKKGLIGLALSGGGIRSATFSLGGDPGPV